jgi:hypothetical protein
MRIEDASPALQLLMRLHHAEYWENGLLGEIVRIAVPVRGRGNPTELRLVSHTMLDAVQRQLDTGTLASREELDFPEASKRTGVGRPKYDPSKVRR